MFNHLVVFRSYRIFMDMFIFLCFGLSIPPVKLLYSLSYQNTSYPLITQSSLSLSVLPRLYMHKQTRFEPLVPVYLSLLSLSFSVSVTCCPTDTHSHTHSESTCIIAPWRENLLVVAVSLTLQLALGSWLLTSCNECVCVCEEVCVKNTERQCVRKSQRTLIREK